MSTSKRTWTHWVLSRTWEGEGRTSEPRTAKPQVELLEGRDLLQGGTWTPVAQNIPDSEGAQHMQLLSDGRIMVQGGNDTGGQQNGNKWYALTPDSSGSYVNGTWTTLASMSTQRNAFGSTLLQDGRFLVVGGEHTGTPLTTNEANTGEIYNPLSNTWVGIPDYPESQFGDGNLETLPNGSVIGTYLNDVQNFIYHPATNNWTPAANKLNGDASAEEGMLKLPDGSLLMYEIQGSAPQTAQRYIPSQNRWVFAGTVPVKLSSNGGNSGIVDELGPAFLLPSGRAFWIGASNHTALYTPSTNTWVAGPDIPNNLGDFDGPGCVLPNGDVLFLAAPQDGNNFPGPTSVFEYSPTTNAITAVPVPSALQTILSNPGTFIRRFIVLPSGQVMLSNSDQQLWIFTPNGGPQNAWRPRIDSIVPNGNNILTLTGEQLNGLDEGSNYGDNDQNATNYPIVRIVDSAGKVFYARTFNWSSTGVATGSTRETVQFVLPKGLSPGVATFFVVANGIPSLPFVVNPVSLYFPFRYTNLPGTDIFTGNLTLVDHSFLPATGTVKILFPSLPPGVTLANPTGFLNGIPYIQVTLNLSPRGPAERIQIRFRDPRRSFLTTFYVGFPVRLIFGP
jgi:hypothetical protein